MKQALLRSLDGVGVFSDSAAALWHLLFHHLSPSVGKSLSINVCRLLLVAFKSLFTDMKCLDMAYNGFFLYLKAMFHVTTAYSVYFPTPVNFSSLSQQLLDSDVLQKKSN